MLSRPTTPTVFVIRVGVLCESVDLVDTSLLCESDHNGLVRLVKVFCGVLWLIRPSTTTCLSYTATAPVASQSATRDTCDSKEKAAEHDRVDDFGDVGSGVGAALTAPARGPK